MSVRAERHQERKGKDWQANIQGIDPFNPRNRLTPYERILTRRQGYLNQLVAFPTFSAVVNQWRQELGSHLDGQEQVEAVQIDPEAAALASGGLVLATAALRSRLNPPQKMGLLLTGLSIFITGCEGLGPTPTRAAVAPTPQNSGQVETDGGTGVTIYQERPAHSALEETGAMGDIEADLSRLFIVQESQLGRFMMPVTLDELPVKPPVEESQMMRLTALDDPSDALPTMYFAFYTSIPDGSSEVGFMLVDGNFQPLYESIVGQSRLLRTIGEEDRAAYYLEVQADQPLDIDEDTANGFIPVMNLGFEPVLVETPSPAPQPTQTETVEPTVAPSPVPTPEPTVTIEETVVLQEIEASLYPAGSFRCVENCYENAIIVSTDLEVQREVMAELLDAIRSSDNNRALLNAVGITSVESLESAEWVLPAGVEIPTGHRSLPHVASFALDKPLDLSQIGIQYVPPEISGEVPINSLIRSIAAETSNPFGTGGISPFKFDSDGSQSVIWIPVDAGEYYKLRYVLFSKHADGLEKPYNLLPTLHDLNSSPELSLDRLNKGLGFGIEMFRYVGQTRYEQIDKSARYVGMIFYYWYDVSGWLQVLGFHPDFVAKA